MGAFLLQYLIIRNYVGFPFTVFKIIRNYVGFPFTVFKIISNYVGFPFTVFKIIRNYVGFPLTVFKHFKKIVHVACLQPTVKLNLFLIQQYCRLIIKVTKCVLLQAGKLDCGEVAASARGPGDMRHQRTKQPLPRQPVNNHRRRRINTEEKAKVVASV